MKKKPSIYYYRKIHRYFGLIIGIQFLFWTLGGIFFSWSDLDQIHGDTNRKSESLITEYKNWMSPSDVFDLISKENPVDSIYSFKTINFFDQAHYQIRYYSNGEQKIVLADAKTANLRSPLSKDEAVQLALNSFTPTSKVKQVDYLTDGMINKHHEYRDRPLPAYAIKFDHKSGTTIYVSTEYGEIATFRNSNWRIFDFLWMMHTMDYKGRDYFGNLLLKAFSILGLITILSGFTLYFTGWRRTFLNRKRT